VFLHQIWLLQPAVAVDCAANHVTACADPPPASLQHPATAVLAVHLATRSCLVLRSTAVSHVSYCAAFDSCALWLTVRSCSCRRGAPRVPAVHLTTIHLSKLVRHPAAVSQLC
jgi:hypothetical protein